eukprot:COSAG01_NODE_7859_length_3022_cov_65.995895_1_plen_195_part_00
MQKNLTTYIIMYYDHTHSSHQHPRPPRPLPHDRHIGVARATQHSGNLGSISPCFCVHNIATAATRSLLTSRADLCTQQARVSARELPPSPTSAAAAAAAAARQHTRQEQAPVESNHPTGFTQSLPRPFTPCSYRRRRGAANQRQGVTCDSSSSSSGQAMAAAGATQERSPWQVFLPAAKRPARRGLRSIPESLG